jgi:hypothetical protein
MADPEGVFARWSRRKLEAAPTAAPTVPPGPEPDAGAQADLSAAVSDPVPSRDVAMLAPLNAITADTDMRAFLEAGVPGELTRLALRRAWSADPAIRDFIGLAENQWDFTDPTSVPGFGPLGAADDVPRLVARALGRLAEADDPPHAAAPHVAHDGPASRAPVAAPPAGEVKPDGAPEKEDGVPAQTAGASARTIVVNAATQHQMIDAKGRSLPERRAHGGALPR